jgi:hypothetical protein
MSYRVEEDSKEKKFKVIEKNTEIVLYKSECSKDARSMCRSLNLGSGFNGLSPRFFSLECRPK